jgi:putative FmdB family regulatory protein
MPIYAYRCADCGHAKDVLQKISDTPLTVCPACGVPRFEKQLTAAGFQLKGSGWYATDFRNNGSPAAKPDAKTDTKPEGKPASTETSAAPTPATASPSPAAAPTPAPAPSSSTS